MSQQTNGLNFEIPKHNYTGDFADAYATRFGLLELYNRNWHTGVCLKGVDENKIMSFHPPSTAAGHVTAVRDFLSINRNVINSIPFEDAADNAIKKGLAEKGEIREMIKDGKPTAIALDFSFAIIGGEEYCVGFNYRMKMIKKSNEKYQPGNYVYDCNPAIFAGRVISEFHRGQIDAVNQFIRNNSELLKLNDINAVQCFTESSGFNIAASGGFASRCVRIECADPAIKVPAMQWLVVRIDRRRKTAAFVAAFFDKGAAVQYCLDNGGQDVFSFELTTPDEADKYLKGYKLEH